MAQCSHVLCLCLDGHADQGGYFSDGDGYGSWMSPRCIFVHRNGKQRKDPYACPPEIRGGEGITFQSVNRSEKEKTINFKKKVTV